MALRLGVLRDAGRESALSATYEQVVRVVRNELTPSERSGAVAYVTAQPIEPGSAMGMPTGSRAWLAFIDREPLANWAHECRYLQIDLDADSVHSVDARFPPFPAARDLGWRIAHRAPAIPDSALFVRSGAASD